MRFRFFAAFSWRCARSLAVGPGGSACPLDDRVLAHQGPRRVKVRLGTVADALLAPLTGVPEAERPSPCL